MRVQRSTAAFHHGRRALDSDGGGRRGAALATAYGYDLTAIWQLYSCLAIVVLILAGFLLHNSWQASVLAASAGPELDALLRSPLPPHRLSAGSVLALLYLMVARPA